MIQRLIFRGYNTEKKRIEKLKKQFIEIVIVN